SSVGLLRSVSRRARVAGGAVLRRCGGRPATAPRRFGAPALLTAVRNSLLVPIGVPAAELGSPAGGHLGAGLLYHGIAARTARRAVWQKATNPSTWPLCQPGAGSAGGTASPSISQPHTRLPVVESSCQ